MHFPLADLAFQLGLQRLLSIEKQFQCSTSAPCWCAMCELRDCWLELHWPSPVQSPIDCSREWDPVQSQCSPLLSSALHTHTHLGRKTVPSVMFNCCFLDGYLGAGILVAEGWFAQGSALMEKAAGYAAPHAVFGPSIPSLPCLCPRAVAQHWSHPHPQGAFLKSWWPVQGILVHLISS